MGTARRITRFGATERFAHWLLAVTTLIMIVTGLFLYIPSLALIVNRPTAKAWHIDAAIALGVGLLLLVVSGNRGALRRFVREADRFDSDDLAWLRGGPRRVFDHRDAPPQGRLNAGQKLNTALSLGLMVVLAVSGVLLYVGERNTNYRFSGTVLTHDFASLAITFLVCGHLYLALLHPATRAALSGVVSGEVDEAWARANHAKWVAQVGAASDQAEAAAAAPTPGERRDRS
jgi:formate dehydrogenase subunit gamma